MHAGSNLRAPATPPRASSRTACCAADTWRYGASCAVTHFTPAGTIRRPSLRTRREAANGRLEVSYGPRRLAAFPPARHRRGVHLPGDEQADRRGWRRVAPAARRRIAPGSPGTRRGTDL